MGFESSWEDEVYSQGRHLNRYPFDVVVSFLFRHYPREKPRSQTRILEVGCGAGNNLWFAAREGFSVFGLDASPSAIGYARDRFAAEGLVAGLCVGDFTALPYPDNFFDLVIDRASITCCGLTDARRSMAEVRRVLAPGGVFLHNAYSEAHFSRTQGRPGPDGVVLDIAHGTLAGLRRIRFASQAEVRGLFDRGWTVENIQHLHLSDLDEAVGDHCEWRVVARKTGDGFVSS